MSFTKRLSARFRNFVANRRGGVRLREEMETHLAMQTAENLETGMSSYQARRQARLKLGSMETVQETYHHEESFALIECLLQDSGFALRQMRKSPGFTLIAIATMMLGIGAATSIFTVVYGAMLRALPYPHADQIIRIHDERLQGTSTGGLVGVPRYFDLTARSKSFESTGFFFFDDTTLFSGNQLPVAVKGASANAGFWQVFTVKPLLGRVFGEGDDRPNAPMVAVLSYGAWQRLFGGDEAVIGRQVTIEQKATTIIGVMPKEFNVPQGMDLWRPAQFVPAMWQWRGEGGRFANVVARLRPGVSIATAGSDLRRIGEQLRHEHADTDGLWQFQSESLRDDLYGGVKPAILVLFVASGVLLLVACINVASLLLARANARQREVALRRALGASEARIRLQFVTEAVILALTGGGGGLGLTWLMVHALAAKLPGRLATAGTVTMNWPVALFAAGLAVACGIAFGFAPALRRSGQLASALKQNDLQVAGKTGRVRNVFISAQVGMSLVLLIGAVLLTESLWNLTKFPLGFVPEHLITFRLALPWNTAPERARNFYADVQQRLQSLPGVAAVGQITALPTEDWHAKQNYDADWLPGTVHHDAMNPEVRSISGQYLRAMGTPLLAGRELVAADGPANPPRVMVNRAFAQQYLPGGNVIGRHLRNDAGAVEIVGVIADVRGTSGSIAAQTGPEVYFSADGNFSSTRRSIVVRSAIPPQLLLPAIREQVHQADAQQAIANVATMDELLNKAVLQPTMNAGLMMVFAALTLVLACVGVYGVVAWSVSQRVREIGVRMALGATRPGICRFFLSRSASATLWGIASGAAAALLLTRFLRSQLYGVSANNPWVFAISIAVLLAPVFVATLHPTLRAASVNPVDALRNE